MNSTDFNPQECELGDLSEARSTDIEPTTTLVPKGCLSNFHWRYNETAIGSNWQLDTKTRRWLEEKQFAWRLQDSFFFRQEKLIYDDVKDLNDAYELTKPMIIFYNPNHAIVFKLFCGLTLG